MTTNLEYAIRDGRLNAQGAGGTEPRPDESLRDKYDTVHASVVAGAVTLRWYARGKNWASLFLASDWMQSFPGPFTLNYYILGWFSETYANVVDARDRLFDLIAKSDVHLSSTIYVREADKGREDIPSLLKIALRDKDADEAHSIDCVYDSESGRYRVNRVGPESSIGKHYGLSPISYPCLTGHSYDHVVSQIYPVVTRSGEPHYDHVYAAFRMPDGDVNWVPYQRVVLPLSANRGKKGVRIVTEMTKVDISPL